MGSQNRNTPPTSQEIGALLSLFNARRYPEAIAVAKNLTQRFPSHSLGWNILGLSLLNMGRHSEALPPMEKAATLAPDDALIFFNLGIIFSRIGRLAEAESSFSSASRIKPDYAEAHNSLGNVLVDSGRAPESEASYLAALKINPNYVQAHNNLGIAYGAMGRMAEAEASFLAALKLNPNYVQAHGNLGKTYKDQGRLAEAEASFLTALKIKPDYAAALFNLANMRAGLGRLQEAESGFRAVLAIHPGHAEAHYSLAVILKDMGRLPEAEAGFRAALGIRNDYAEAHNNLGNLLLGMGRITEAESSFLQALKINPIYAKAHNNLGNAFMETGRLAEAEAAFRKALLINPNDPEASSNLLFLLNIMPNTTPVRSYDEARQYGRYMAHKIQARFTNWPSKATPARLRIGFVSGDIRNHPVGYFLEGLLSKVDRDTFELIAYTTTSKTDALTERIKPYLSDWKSMYSLSDEAAAQLIHDDGLHILVDLSGHTAGNRLPVFAWKPAPVQVSWLGYFATTGLAEMDHIIADPWTLPESEAVYFTENIWRLPETRLCFTPPDIDLDISPLPALTNGWITFGCFNNLTKMGDDVVALWARVLDAVPDSRLLLKAKQLNDAHERQQTIKRFTDQGIEAHRLILEGSDPRAAYLTAYHRVDISLDPFPYPGGTTSAEGLWMGVPVLTLTGERFLSRQGVGILMNAGLSDWIATDADDYVARAVSHAADLVKLARLRQELRQQVLASPLFDAARFARNFEAAMQGMWQQFTEQRQSPQSLVQPDFYKINEAAQNRVVIVSATQRNEADFWDNSALGCSLPHHLKHDARLSVNIAFENTRGLPEIYNRAIEQAEDDDVLVFMHDDVWIDETDAFADILFEGLAHFDVVGVAGNRRRLPKQPAWAFIDSKLTRDNPEHLSGRIAHGKNAIGGVTYFGSMPAECELLDGVFLATQKNRLKKENVRFDPRFDFHFYDLDFCRSARKSALKLGTWPIKLTHQSHGAYHSEHWREKSRHYLEKWE
jgi:protein O-GlcNAc transferase